MKWTLLIITMLFISLNLRAGRKFLIETEYSTGTVKLINSKLSKTIDLLPMANKTNFFFEVDDMENIFLKFSNNLKIKLYSLNDKVETDWRPVEGETEIPVKSFFSSNTKKDVELSEFFINSFRTRLINSAGGNMRGNNFFYTTGEVNFTRPEKLFFSWKSGLEVIEIKVDNLNVFTKNSSNQTFNDTILQYKDLPESVKKNLIQKPNHFLFVKTKSDVYGYHDNKLIFEIDSFGFTDPDKDSIFIHEQNLKIGWDAPKKETTVKVFDNDNKIVYNAQTTQKYWSFNESKKIPFNYRRPYKIELTQGNKTISKNFYVLFNYVEYMKLTLK